MSGTTSSTFRWKQCEEFEFGTEKGIVNNQGISFKLQHRVLAERDKCYIWMDVPEVTGDYSDFEDIKDSLLPNEPHLGS